jgi:nucleotide-binding universal stress UspA family protein
MMFRRLLVAFDESPEAFNALQAALDLASTLGVELFAVTVEESLPPYMTITEPDAVYVTPAIIQEIEEQRKAYYAELHKKAVSEARTRGVTLHTVVVPGDEVEAIVDYARRHECDLIIVGFHKHSALADRLWGSTAHGITMAAHCSVLAVKSTAGRSDG